MAVASAHLQHWLNAGPQRNVVVEVGSAGLVPWIPRDSLCENDFCRLNRIVGELQKRGFQVEVRRLDTPPARVIFKSQGEGCDRVLYVADHIREFYADGSGQHFDRALQAVVTGSAVPTHHYTDES
mmetsp:Transcript_35891/g.83535  ORF Transcript_35891/g.83535 Transcript_35891/m.83535 type:complete len:126 (-) Transcript_35891:113-490(-)